MRMELTPTNIVSIACCAFVLCGFVANVFVLYVFYRFKTIRHRPSSASLISLTLFDLLMCASTIFLLINRMFEDVQGGMNVLYCHLINGLAFIFMLCSCMMIVYIAFDRWNAMTWPLQYKSKPHVKRAVIASVVSFAISTIVVSPTVFHSTEPLMGNVQCVAHRLWPRYFLTFYLTVSEVLAVALVVLYCMARYKLYAHNAQFLADRQSTEFSSVQQMKREQENQMSKSILSTVTPYLCLFSAPCTIMMIGSVTNMTSVVGLAGLMMGSGALINSSINVFVYCWKLPDFKPCVVEALVKKPVVQNAAAASKPVELPLKTVSHNVKSNKVQVNNLVP